MEKMHRDKFAEFIISTHYDEFTDEVVHQAKRCILDFFGVAFAGSSVGFVPLITDVICGMGGRDEATIIGYGEKYLHSMPPC